MQSGSGDGGVGGEYEGGGLVDISKICVTQYDFFQMARTIWHRDHVCFTPDNADVNVISSSCLSRHEINNAGLILRT